METIIFIISATTLYFVYDSRKRIQNIESHILNLKDEVKKQNTSDASISDDEMFEKAKQAVIEAGKASTSFLQRKLGVGYARASKLIDTLEEKGVVQSGKGSNPRTIISSTATTPEVHHGKKNKILFIDDDKFLLNLLKIKFEQNGYEATTLTNVNGNIVQIVSEINPDLISLDTLMPGRDGFEALKILKKDVRTKNIPVIFFTNLEAEQDIKKGIGVGAVDYLICAEITPSEVTEIYSNYLSNPKKYVPRYIQHLKA